MRLLASRTQCPTMLHIIHTWMPLASVPATFGGILVYGLLANPPFISHHTGGQGL